MVVSRSWEVVLLTGMLLAFLVVSLLLLRQKGLFIDDSMHMPAGYSYLLTHDYRLNQEHPPLIKLLSGLGVLRVRPEFPFDSPGWEQAATPEDPDDGMTKIEEAFFERNAKEFERIAWYGRLPMLIVPVLLLLAVWWLARQMFGPVGGLIAAFLLASEPNIIGNSIVVQNDVASALATVLFVLALKRFVSKPGAWIGQRTGGRIINALLLGGALGIALATKYSLLVLAPVALGIFFVRGLWLLIRKQFSVKSDVLLPLLAFATAYLVLIAFYSFKVNTPWLLPRYFIYGVDMVRQATREGRPAFLLGQVSDTGWWYYFPVAFALKTTIPFLLTSIGGLVWATVEVIRHKRFVLLYALLPSLLYLAATMASHLNIGVRHLLPMFPFVAVAGAGFVTTLINLAAQRDRRLSLTLAILLLAPSLAIAILTFPNYLTYFSPLAGGAEHGWEKLSDANVETGQEVKTLAKYLKARGQTRVTGVMVGGEFLRFYGVELEDFAGWEEDDDDDGDEAADQSSPAPDTDYVAIGAWYFTEIDLTDKQRTIIEIYRKQKPEAMVGNSIFVFRR